MSQATAPDSDEIEVSVFGPGRGECVVVHLGGNEWCIIDSCIPKGYSSPIALHYLDALGVAVGTQVRLVVATHWHDDHIRGLSTIMTKCEAAQFSCSIALRADQYRRMISEEADAPLDTGSGVREFADTFRLLLARKEANVPTSHVTPIFAGVNKRLLDLRSGQRPFQVSVLALSPSDGLLRRNFVDAQHWMRDNTGRERPQNETSVAMWLELGDRHILLGADLEVEPHAGAGWLAVLSAFQAPRRADFYKVAHHGSSNGDCSEIWELLLDPNSHAVVTPYNSSRLPTREDLERLRSRSNAVFLTASPTSRLPRRDSLVEKELRRVKRRVVDLQPGHVRWRWKLGDVSPNVELFNGAVQVT